jgi:hypothetical protein
MTTSSALLTGLTGNTTGVASATEGPIVFGLDYTVSAPLTVVVTGTFGGGTLSLEVNLNGGGWSDGSGSSSPASLTAPGTITYTGACKGIRCKVTGASGANISAELVMNDKAAKLAGTRPITFLENPVTNTQTTYS